VGAVWRPVVAVAALFPLVGASCAVLEDTKAHEAFSDASGNGMDAGGHVQTTDAGREARAFDAGDAQVRADATSHDGARGAFDAGDAGRPLGYCASLPPPPVGAAVLCDDFDSDPDAGILGATITSPGEGTLAVQSTVFRSPPNAVSFTANSLDGGPVHSLIQRLLPPSKVYTLQFDLYIATLDVAAGGETAVASLAFGVPQGEESILGIQVTSGPDGGITSVQVTETDPVDGGSRFTTHAPHTQSLIGWNHVVLQLTAVSAPADSLTINGNPLEGNFPLMAAFSVAKPLFVQVGVTNSPAVGARHIYVDNVLVVAE